MKILKYSIKKINYFITFILLLLTLPTLTMEQSESLLPHTTGNYSVGTTSYHLVDTSRLETHALHTEHPFRELMVYAYYPIDKYTQGTRVSYLGKASDSIKELLSTILKRRLNLEKIGLMGHSFGGLVTTKACRQDCLFKACVNIDGKLRGNDIEIGFSKPFMILLSDRFIDNNESSRNEVRQFANLTQNMQAPAYNLMIEGVHHASFSDYDLITKSYGRPESKQWHSKLSPTQAIKIIRALLVDFFNVYLKDQSPSVLEGDITLYPEIYPNMSPEELLRREELAKSVKEILLVQVTSDSTELASLIKEVTPIINSIVKEKLNLSKDYANDFFSPKQENRVTLYYIENVTEQGKDSIVSALDKFFTEQKLPENVYLGSKVDFFNGPFGLADELVVLIDDPNKELVQLNQKVKEALHQANSQFEQTHKHALYYSTKSEQYPYIPHIGLGRLRSNTIKEHIKDVLQFNTVFESIKQSIKEAILPIISLYNQKISFNNFRLFDQKKRETVKVWQ